MTRKGQDVYQWTPAGDGYGYLKHPEGLKPLYGLSDVVASTSKVVIVEGENVFMPVEKRGPSETITCWAGGTNAWHQTDWTPLAGSYVSLLADGMSPGHKAMQALALHLSGIGMHGQDSPTPHRMGLRRCGLDSRWRQSPRCQTDK